MNEYVQQKLEKSISYKEYRALVDSLLAEGKVTGETQTQGRLDNTKLNVSKMNRIERSFVMIPALEEALAALKRNLIWIVITEGWCVDSAQSLPVINAAAEKSDKIDLRILMRDENLDLMNKYLTGGSMSVPKLISFDKETLGELGVWGPRPEPAQELLADHKKGPDFNSAAFQKELQLWYAKDKTIKIQEEMAEMIIKN